MFHLTLSFVLLENGQTYFKNFAVHRINFQRMFGHFTTLYIKKVNFTQFSNLDSYQLQQEPTNFYFSSRLTAIIEREKLQPQDFQPMNRQYFQKYILQKMSSNSVLIFFKTKNLRMTTFLKIREKQVKFRKLQKLQKGVLPGNIYIFKVNNRKIRNMLYEIQKYVES